MTVAAGDLARATYEAGHEGAILVDGGRRPRLRMAGSARAAFLHRITTGDIKALSPGLAAPTLLITGKGRLIDRLTVLCRDEDLLVVGSADAGPVPGDVLRRYVVFDDVQISDLAEATCLLEVHGPRAAAVLAAAGCKVTEHAPDENQGAGPPWEHGLAELGGVQATVSRNVGLNGPSWWILAAAADHARLSAHLHAAGADLGLVTADADGWEVLQVEAGLVRSGHEVSEKWNPLEMRQEDALSFDKGCYVGQEVMARLRTYDRVKRRLWRVSFAGAQLPAAGSTIHAAPGDGTITSAAVIPGEDRCVVLAVLPGDDPAPGGELTALIQGAERPGEIVGPPPTAADMRVAPPETLGKRRFGD